MRQSFIPAVLMLMLAVLLGTHLQTTYAQEQQQQEPITPGENKLGEVTPQNPGPMYQFTGPENTPLVITVTSNDSNFAPVINLYDQNFGIVQRASNPAQIGRVSLNLPASETSADYLVQVLGVGGQHGQFVLSLAVSPETVPPVTALAIGQEIDDQVSVVEPSKQYLISAQPGQDMFVQVTSLLPDGGPVIVLSDVDGSVVGVSNNMLLGGTFIIPATVDRQYHLTVAHSGADRREDYLVSVRPLRDAAPVAAQEPDGVPDVVPEPEVPNEASVEAPDQSPDQVPDATSAQTPVVIEAPTATPMTDSEGEVIIPFDGPCALTSNSALGVNVRRGPGEGYDINGGVMPGQVVVVTGRDEEIAWWQVEIQPGRYGWVVDSGVRRGGDCSEIGVASYGPPPDGGIGSDSETSSE